MFTRFEVALLTALIPGAVEGQIPGFAGAEFTVSAPSGGEASATGAMALRLSAEWGAEWGRGRHRVIVRPFVRADLSGTGASRVDLREATWWGRWPVGEAFVGVHDVFWGVTESRHVVDVVNQIDPVATVEGRENLGQPAVGARFGLGPGAMTLMIMPAFRTRAFNGPGARLWSPLEVLSGTGDASPFRASLDGALRWSGTLGAWDLGISHFEGTLRDPGFRVDSAGGGGSVLVPVYSRGRQTGLDVSVARGRWLWKAELMTRDGFPGRFWAAAGGAEYSVAEYVSVFAEYSHDSRGSEADTSVERDLYLGAQLLTLSGAVRAGAYVDTHSGNLIVSTSLGHRLSHDARLSVDLGLHIGDESAEPAYAFRRSGFLTISVVRFF